MCCVASANFRVNSTRCSSEFHVAFEHFEDFRDLIFEDFERQNDYILRRGLFYPHRAFTITQSKRYNKAITKF